MSDMRIQCSEEMVGANHPTKTDTLNRLVLVEHNEDGTHKWLPAGYINGLTPSYKDADELTIRSGVIDIDGIPRVLSAPVDKAFSGLGTNTWYHLVVYISGDSDTTLDAGNFGASNNASPVWNDTYKYWGFSYGGWNPANCRCIGAFRTDGSMNIKAFYIHGNKFQFLTPMSILSTTVDPGSLTTLGADVPVITEADVYGSMMGNGVTYMVLEISSNGGDFWYLVESDQSASGTGHLAANSDAIMTNGAKQIYYRPVVAGGGTFTAGLSLKGFKLPAGYAHG